MSGRAKAGVLTALVATPLTMVAVSAGVMALGSMELGSAELGNAEVGSAEAVRTCTAEELPLSSGASDYEVVGGDPSGRYLVGTNTTTSMVWAGDGSGREIYAPNGSSDPRAHDVNSSGIAVGESFDDDSQIYVGWVFAAGGAERLAEPPKTEYSDYTATGINDNGDIVGYYDTGDHYQPVVWSAANPGEIRELSLAGSSGSVQPIDVSNEGAIVGREVDGDGNHVFVWPDAVSDGSRLESPAGSDQVRAYDINGDWVAGREGTGEEAAGVLWNLADGTAKQVPEPLTAVNSDGDATTALSESGRVIRSDGTRIELPALDDPDQRGAKVVFDRGGAYVAAGSDRDADGTDHPVVWSDC